MLYQKDKNKKSHTHIHNYSTSPEINPIIIQLTQLQIIRIKKTSNNLRNDNNQDPKKSSK